MISLSLILLLINIIVIVAVIFANVFKSRVIATSLLMVDLFAMLLKVFDNYVFNNQIEDFFIDLVRSLNLTTSATNPNFIVFIAGLIVLLQLFVVWLMLYALLRRFVPYKPPVLLSKHEERTLLNEAVLWKSLLFISLNIMMIYVLAILNHAAKLPFGLLEPLFRIGFGVRS